MRIPSAAFGTGHPRIACGFPIHGPWKKPSRKHGPDHGAERLAAMVAPFARAETRAFLQPRASECMPWAILWYAASEHSAQRLRCDARLTTDLYRLPQSQQTSLGRFLWGLPAPCFRFLDMGPSVPVSDSAPVIRDPDSDVKSILAPPNPHPLNACRW